MKTIQNGVLAVALSLLFLALSGCGTGSDRPELGLVGGTIRLDGKPLGGVAVVFYPDNGRPARGKTDPNGNYELTYIHKTPGTKVGHNRVEIAPNEEGAEEEEEEDSEETGDTENTGAAKKPAKPRKVKVPARYNVDSELEVDVKPGENEFNFELESKPAE